MLCGRRASVSLSLKNTCTSDIQGEDKESFLQAIQEENRKTFYNKRKADERAGEGVESKFNGLKKHLPSK